MADFGAWAVNLRPNWHRGGIQSIAALGIAMARERKTLNLRRSFRQSLTTAKEPCVPEGIQLCEGLGKVLTSLSPGWIWAAQELSVAQGRAPAAGSQLGKVLCHGFALAGGRNQEVAAPAAPSGILGHRHGSCPQHLPGPVSVLVCGLTSSPRLNLSHHLSTAAPASPCPWSPFPVADLC